MKCWECKNKINEGHCVHYYSPDEDKEKTRLVCPSCKKMLKFDPCHYVRVYKITQRQLKLKVRKQYEK